MSSEIKITIHTKGEKLGQIEVEGEGYDGRECVNDIDELQRILGMVTQDEKTKPEYQKRVSIQRQEL